MVQHWQLICFDQYKLSRQYCKIYEIRLYFSPINLNFCLYWRSWSFCGDISSISTSWFQKLRNLGCSCGSYSIQQLYGKNNTIQVLCDGLKDRVPSQWRHNGRDGVSNHQPPDCLLNRLFKRRSKKTSKLRAPGLCAGNSSVTGEFPTQRASNTENVSIWWRHHAVVSC